MISSFLVIDKPAGITSHDVVAGVRAVTGIKKVGHTGTLDPFATGVLALALGGATRLIQHLDESVKIYDATVSLGFATDTGDLTGTAIREAEVPELTEDHVRDVLATFVGERMQTPPAYSAVKYKGKPLYWYARRGETVEVPARPITIRALELLERTDTTVRVLITCSRGTYARVIAEEIGEALGTAGHLSALARTRSGPFLIEESLSMPDLATIVSAEPGRDWKDVLMGRGKREERVPWRPRDVVRAELGERYVSPVRALSHLPLLDVDDVWAKRVANGAPPPGLAPGVTTGDRFLVVHGDSLIALAEATTRGPASVRVFGA